MQPTVLEAAVVRPALSICGILRLIDNNTNAMIVTEVNCCRKADRILRY